MGSMSQPWMRKAVCAHFSTLSVFQSIPSRCLLINTLELAVLWTARFHYATAFPSIQTQTGPEATAYGGFHILIATGLSNTGICVLGIVLELILFPRNIRIAQSHSINNDDQHLSKANCLQRAVIWATLKDTVHPKGLDCELTANSQKSTLIRLLLFMHLKPG